MFDFDASNIWAMLMISCIGTALLMYGKKAQKLWPMLGGLAMWVYPLFITSWLPLWLITGGILGVLYYLRDK